MNQNKNTGKTICIIGTGIGGLTAGAFLTQQGYHVTLFEKEQLLGGRALSLDGSSLTLDNYTQLLSAFHMDIPFAEPSLDILFDKKMLAGYTLDLGFHAIGGGVVSNLKHILSSLNEHIDMLESRLAYIKNGSFDYPFLSLSDKMKMLPNILRLMLAGESTMKQLDSVSMSDTIKKYGKGKMKLTLEIFPRVIATINNLDIISSGETFRAQKNLLKGSKAVGYPKHGLQSISQALADFIKRHGGEIHFQKPVTKIVIEDNKATGAVIGDEERYFDTIVSNVPVQNLFGIAHEKYFPSEYVKNIKSLQGTGSLCAYYSLNHVDPHLLGKSFLFIERDAGVDGDDAVGMIDFITALPDTGLALPNAHLVQAYIICTPKEAQTKKTLEHLREILENKVKSLIPRFHSQLQWALYPAVWQLDGVAKTIDQVKPEITTPVDNLYLVGDCVKAPGIGINCALNSAKKFQTIFSGST